MKTSELRVAYRRERATSLREWRRARHIKRRDGYTSEWHAAVDSALAIGRASEEKYREWQGAQFWDTARAAGIA